MLAVVAHPDDESFGLGAILDAFIFAGARVEVLCLTHGQTWTLDEAPGDLASLRGLSWPRRPTCSARPAPTSPSSPMGP